MSKKFIGHAFEENSTFDYYIAPLLPSLNFKNNELTIRYPKCVESELLSLIALKLFPKISCRQSYKSTKLKIFFFDDDILDLSAYYTLPFPYALRLWIKVGRYKPFLQLIFKKIWVSNIYLAHKYKFLEPKVLHPIATGDLLIRAQKKRVDQVGIANCRICYHGSWSHKNEIAWISLIIKKVQLQCPHTVFEIIGGDRVKRYFNGTPRVEILDTMTWKNYLKHTSNIHQDIGLAPLMDTLFNRGRGPIKFFDYARAGAVGLYSKGPAFGGFVADGVDGFLLDNDPKKWIEKIIELVNNPQLRQVMADKAWEKVLDNSPASQSVRDYLNGFQT